MFVVLQEQRRIVRQFIFLEEANDNGPPKFPLFRGQSSRRIQKPFSNVGVDAALLLVGTLAADA
ncbi:hypothetical protein EYF80_067324 [Liparis tanakae]|uniref:Uncharacterized protein n=1 Tax=Liparis tanakae TaxID=230148 RepID=A0A4Z2E2G0_9TELE|nr:hypothetical protein EYF80_067324 [Liparis tanakae]